MSMRLCRANLGRSNRPRRIHRRDRRFEFTQRPLLLPHFYWPIDGDKITDGDSLNWIKSIPIRSAPNLGLLRLCRYMDVPL